MDFSPASKEPKTRPCTQRQGVQCCRSAASFLMPHLCASTGAALKKPCTFSVHGFFFVGYTGFEPVTSALSRQRSKPTELIALIGIQRYVIGVFWCTNSLNLYFGDLLVHNETLTCIRPPHWLGVFVYPDQSASGFGTLIWPKRRTCHASIWGVL